MINVNDSKYNWINSISNKQLIVYIKNEIERNICKNEIKINFGQLAFPVAGLNYKFEH